MASFLSTLAGDLKASVSKSATNLYTATLDKAQNAANNLFQKIEVGDVADLKAGTIPASAVPQLVTAPVSTSPALPAAVAPEAVKKNHGKYILIVLAIAAAIYFLKKKE